MAFSIFNLSNTYRSRFARNGYVLLQNYFSKDEAKHIVKCANELQEYPEVKEKWMIYFEKDKDNNKKKSRIENIYHYHDGIRNLLTNRVNGTLNIINGGNMTLFKDKLNWKFGGGNGFNAHQDQYAWSDFPPNQFISISMFGNKSTIENGCLEFAYNCVDRKYLMDANYENLGELTNEVEARYEWVPIETTPRDLLLFDSYVPHRSGPNTTEKDRRIFYFTYHNAYYGNFYEEYFTRKRKEFPPDFERTGDQKVVTTGSKYNVANPFV